MWTAEFDLNTLQGSNWQTRKWEREKVSRVSTSSWPSTFDLVGWGATFKSSWSNLRKPNHNRAFMPMTRHQSCTHTADHLASLPWTYHSIQTLIYWHTYILCHNVVTRQLSQPCQVVWRVHQAKCGLFPQFFPDSWNGWAHLLKLFKMDVLLLFVCFGFLLAHASLNSGFM